MNKRNKCSAEDLTLKKFCFAVSSRSVLDHSWRTPETTAAHLEAEGQAEPTPALTSTPLKDGYVRFKK